MRSFLALWRREFAAIFLSPIAYVTMMFFLIITGCGFSLLIKENLELANFTQGLVIIIWSCTLIVIPILTMRTFSEERRSGTFEMLLTAPVRDTTIVMAKFAGALSFFILICAPTILYLLVTRWVAPEVADLVDPGAILGGYLMLTLISAAFISLGILTSAITSNQIISAIVTFTVMCILFAGGLFLPLLAKTHIGKEVSSYLSPALHLLEAARGVFDTRTIILYLSANIFFLFATIKAISIRR